MTTLAVPAWAERITVERDGEQLIVRGEGRTGLATRQGMASQNDLLWQYAQFTKPWTGKDRTGTRLPHIQFANAMTDEDLIGFVRRFGPLLASVSSLSDRNPVVTQDLRVLRRERLLFAGAIRLLPEINRDKRRNGAVVAEALAEISEGTVRSAPLVKMHERRERYEVHEHKLALVNVFRDMGEEGGFSDSAVVSTSIKELRDRELLWKYGQRALCLLLNRYPPLFLPVAGRIMEAPPYDVGGILPVLYYMLRQDFLREQPSGICARVECGRFFVIERSGQRFCCAECSRLQRQREYWNDKGKARRQERQAERPIPNKGR